MKNVKLIRKRIIAMICLLVTVGILFVQDTMSVHAMQQPVAGEEEEDRTSTILDPAGTANTPDDLNKLNTGNIFTLTLDGEGNGQLNGMLRILITLTLIALLPTILMMMTSFTRIIIVLHFTRAALNTQTAPPNQVLIGLALILTFFIMGPTVTRINEEAIQPFEAGEITQEEFFEAGVAPLRDFMYPQKIGRAHV